jgi:hypothetical protein
MPLPFAVKKKFLRPHSAISQLSRVSNRWTFLHDEGGVVRPAVSRGAGAAALPPFVVREEPDAALDEEALAGVVLRCS